MLNDESVAMSDAAERCVNPSWQKSQTYFVDPVELFESDRF
jgi:hypothetical protein